MNNKRLELYNHYITELSAYNPELAKEKNSTINGWATSYIKEGNWIDIVGDSGQLCGFLIISSLPEDCHPDCDWYICQAYVIPEYREQGFMTNAVFKFIRNNPGIYGFDILRGNDYAEKFWLNIFKKIRAEKVELSRLRANSLEDNLELYGFLVK